jgi:hypothetical protein
MSGKSTAVFWLGLILIFLNFWISGQSSSLWDAITLPAAGTNTASTTPSTTNYSTGQVAGANQTIVNVAGRGK